MMPGHFVSKHFSASHWSRKHFVRPLAELAVFVASSWVAIKQSLPTAAQSAPREQAATGKVEADSAEAALRSTAAKHVVE